jgi:hypothetical protein
MTLRDSTLSVSSVNRAMNQIKEALISDRGTISDPARLIIMSLTDHPHLDTAHAIENGPYGIEAMGAAALESGFAELAAMDPPLALPKPAGGWQLT